jgi:hypothetical protein
MRESPNGLAAVVPPATASSDNAHAAVAVLANRFPSPLASPAQNKDTDGA